MGKIKTIDTNVIIRFLVWDDKSLYKKSRKIFEEIENQEIEVYISEWVILECLYALTKFYSIDKKDVVDKLKMILFLDNVINPDKLEIIEALSLVVYENIDFVDALLITKAKYNDFEILSLDNKINKLYMKNNTLNLHHKAKNSK